MIVITGGSGFIGSNIAAALTASTNEDLVVCDWPDKTKEGNLADCRIADFVSPDELPAYLQSRVGSIEAIIHMGANSSTDDPDLDQVMRYNLEFSTMLWEWCSRHRVRLIYASSASTYGDGALGFDDTSEREALLAFRPLNAYGISKHAFDLRVARLSRDGAPTPPQCAGLKFFNVYGPREDHKGDMRSVIAKCVPTIRRGEPVRLFRSYRPGFADGEQKRDFVYVRDCVRVVEWLLRTPGAQGLFNVGSGTARSFLDLANAVFKALDLPPNIAFVDMPIHLRDRYQYFTQAPLDRLRAAGYSTAPTPLEDGVDDYVRTYLSLR